LQQKKIDEFIFDFVLDPLEDKIVYSTIYSKQKTTGSLLDSVLNANGNMARIILENKGLF
jgi:hypothetical protein